MPQSWPSEDVYFSPEDALPAFVTGAPALSSGSEVWITVHNHSPEPLRLHSGQNIGVLEIVTVADAKTSSTSPESVCQPPIPEHLSPLQQQQLNNLFKEFSDVFSQGEDDLGCTPLLKHTIETQGPPLRQPPAAKPGCPAGGDGADPANASQRCHPSLEQPMGLTGGDGEKKRWQPMLLR